MMAYRLVSGTRVPTVVCVGLERTMDKTIVSFCSIVSPDFASSSQRHIRRTMAGWYARRPQLSIPTSAREEEANFAQSFRLGEILRQTRAGRLRTAVDGSDPSAALVFSCASSIKGDWPLDDTASFLNDECSKK